MPELDVANLAVWYLVFVFSTTCHEAAHAFVAYRGGDLTAYSLGHVSLDPTPHIRRSPFGMVVMPIVGFLFFGSMIGWASVPVNRSWAVDHPRRAAVMSLAGPAANFLLATLALLAMRLLVGGGVLELGGGPNVTVPEGQEANTLLGALARGLSVMLVLNVILGLFNLIPLPPLDGASVFEGIAPRASASIYQHLRDVPAIEILGLVAAMRLFSYVSRPALDFVAGLLQS